MSTAHSCYKFATVWIMLVFYSSAQNTRTARDFYNELHTAKGLAGAANQYVCFGDDVESDTFFIFSEARLMRQFLEESGESLPKKDKEMLDNLLIFRHYKKGVATTGREEWLTKDGEAWLGEPVLLSGKELRVRFILNWQTLRYSRAAEWRSKNQSLWIPKYTIYGKCEHV